MSTDFGAGRQALWLDGGIHAREWIAPATMVYYIDEVQIPFYLKELHQVQ